MHTDLGILGDCGYLLERRITFDEIWIARDECLRKDQERNIFRFSLPDEVDYFLCGCFLPRVACLRGDESTARVLTLSMYTGAACTAAALIFTFEVSMRVVGRK